MENQVLDQVPYHMAHGYGGGDGACSFFPGGDHAAAAINPTNLPWSSSLPASFHSTNPAASLHQVDQELAVCPGSLPPFAPSLYGAGAVYPNPSPAGLMELAGGSAFMGLNRFLRGTDIQGSSASSSLFGTIHAELGKLTAQEIMDAKALAASKNHSEAERRRRERINGHLAKLRSMLPNTTKVINTDKASLLAEVIQHVKELKRQTSEIAEESPLPTEADEVAVESACDEDGKLVARASLCCDDRPDLLPDLIGALKALRLRVLKAEITTVGGRVKNVLVVSHAEEQDDDPDDAIGDVDGGHIKQQQLMAAVQDALRAVLEQATKHDQSPGGTKRQRTAGLSAAGLLHAGS
ncbi:transcription factor AIG1-like isoform X2 [Zingiber officinale]|uniref:transcription factor AIG1-like isoform X2 n=1 Tax=Zingiber officinale TaxID=94328 RepID=UPI001C4D88EE|nr:transcription factor AIG1-like isoform X2 [Zingiber officinale]